jgi:hypothetical protein
MGLKRHKRFLWLALATFMMTPAKAKARPRTYIATASAPPPQKQSRRRFEREHALQALPPVVSPCGRHVATVAAGAVFVDGRRIHPTTGSVHVLAPPIWRRDGGAVAWLERGDGETRLVVLPEMARGASALPWALPVLTSSDQLFWAGPNRVVIGPGLLQPRAIATWTP